MPTLNGEQIEDLLWENGLDFQHVLDEDDTASIEVYVGEYTIEISETWMEEGEWFLEGDTAVLVKIFAGETVGSDFGTVSEKDLIEKILTLGEIDG